MYLQGVLNAVREVLESAQWDGIACIWSGRPIGIGQVRHHYKSVTFAS